MRICSPQLGLNPNSILGGEVFDREILLGLAHKGVKVEIILPKGKPFDQGIKNWHITNLPIKHFPAIFASLIFVPYLWKAYSKRPFNIIRLHSPRYLGLAAFAFKLFKSSKSQVKLVATYHRFGESKFGFLSRSVNNLWDHIVCDSQNVKNKLIESYKISSTKITVVHNGVPNYLKASPKDKKVIQQLKLDRKLVLLFMGLFIERKNPFFLLEVLSELKKTRSNLVLIFWGEGPLKSRIMQKAKDKGIEDHIRIIGPIFGFKKNKVHNLADIFVHPSQDEGFALAPLEAMACAKPIVMTKGYSASEAVEDGLNGFLCRKNDVLDWSKKIRLLIAHYKLREKMGRYSLKKVKKEFIWSTAVEKHWQILKNLDSETN